jgi:hypothetical protein
MAGIIRAAAALAFFLCPKAGLGLDATFGSNVDASGRAYPTDKA